MSVRRHNLSAPKAPLAVTFTTVLLLFSISCSRPAALTQGPSLAILYNAEEQPTEKSAVAQLLQSEFRQKGISVRLDPVSNTLYNERLSKGDFEATLNLWYLDYNDPEGYLTDFYSKAGYRSAKYSSAEYDGLYLAGLLAPTEADKVRYFREAVTLLDHEVPWIPLYSNTEIFLLQPRAAGFRSNAYQYYDYRRVDMESIRASSDVEVQTLDPALAYDLASKHIVTQSYEGLIALDANSKIVPALATEWQFSPKMDSLTFRLRAGVRFHTAPFFKTAAEREVTSIDVKSSFERMLKSNSPYTYIFDHVQGAQEFKAGKSTDIPGFRARDKYTFQIVLDRPFPTILEWLLAPAAYVLPKGLPSNYDLSRGSVGTGPFILQSWDGVTARFVANPEYWAADETGRRLPYPKTLTLRIIKDANTALTGFRQGELDVLNVPLALFSDVFELDGRVKPAWHEYQLHEVKLNNLKFLAFNMQKGPWGNDLGLRRRVDEAINRDLLVKQLFRGKARPAYSVIPSGVPGFE
ncbi:MAG TPA: ABC transporter substrate-binding protein [Terriglobales bacterium]|nr:ABC transporter substrate-binding protein [Terriglobales bacterium]HZT32740.1 ABC transporter substrate-binding protein [Bryobacteraceae bacterium]